MELAKYCNNLSYLLGQLGDDDLAKARSRQALDLLDALALPAPSLGIEQADAHNLRGQLVAGAAIRAARWRNIDRRSRFRASRGRTQTAHYLAPVHSGIRTSCSNLARLSRGQSRSRPSTRSCCGR